MSSTSATQRLRIRTRSLMLAWLIILVPTLVGAAALQSSRILMWIITSATLAGLLYPIAQRGAKYMPYTLSVILTMVLMWVTLGYGAYSAVDNLVTQSRNLRESAPRIISSYESGDSVPANLVRDAKLSERASAFFRELPDRLRGGPPVQAIRGYATRGVIALVINIMAIFFLLHGKKFVYGVLSPIENETLRDRWQGVVVRTFHRSFTYLRGSIIMAITAGGVAYIIARLANVPSPFPLAIYVAVWDLVPVIGVAAGGLPIALLAAGGSEKTAIIVLVVFILYQIFESAVLQPSIERRSVRPGAFLSFLALFGGLEAFGFGGMLLTLVAITVLVTFIDEIFPDTDRADEQSPIVLPKDGI